MTDKNRLTFEEACRELHMSEDELEKLVAAGEIASIKEGDTLFFKPEVVEQFKKSRQTEPNIILSDDELDLLDGVDELSIDDIEVAPAGEEAAPVAASGDDVSLEDLDLSDLSLEDDTAGDTAAAGVAADDETADDFAELSLEGLEEPETAAAETGDDTVFNLDGLLEEESASEATTPVPGTDVGDLDLDSDTSDDITLEASVSDDDTILDTDVLDLEGEDSFELEPTAEDDIAGDASTLIRGGGARVMQMKRVKGHPIMTSVVLVTAIFLMIPMAVLTNVYFYDKESAPQPSKKIWVEDHHYGLKGFIESGSDFLYGLLPSE